MNSTAFAFMTSTYFHVWFATKRRQDALQGEIRDMVLASFADTGKRAEINVVEAEAQFDHVHFWLK